MLAHDLSQWPDPPSPGKPPVQISRTEVQLTILFLFIADYLVQGHTFVKGPSWQDFEHSIAKIRSKSQWPYCYSQLRTWHCKRCMHLIIRIGGHIPVGVFRPNRCHLNTFKCLLVQFGEIRFETIVSFWCPSVRLSVREIRTQIGTPLILQPPLWIERVKKFPKTPRIWRYLEQ